MGHTVSVLRVRFDFYCLVARNMPSSDSASLAETFCNLPGSTLDKPVKTSSFRGIYKSSLGQITSVL